VTIAASGYVGPTSMFATDLSLTYMPDWVRAATLHRTARMERPDWHTLARMALDVSELAILPRTAARVLIDWHGKRATSVIVQVSDIARRVPAHRVNTHRALDALVAAGWLSRVPQPGSASILTLLVPLEPVAHGYTPPVADDYTPVADDYTPCSPRLHHQGQGAEGHSQGHVDSMRDAVPRGAADPWDGFYAPTRYEDGDR
jgi:hypothetical protein